jgi:hypothetical protein
MFSTKWSRQLAMNLVIALALEFATLYVVCLFLADRRYESPITYAFIGLAGLYAFRVANGVLNIIVNSAVYYVTKRQRVSSLVAMFYQYRIPVNEETMFTDGNGLYEAIAASKDTSEDAKRFAIMSIGEFNGIRFSNRTLGLMQMYAVSDAAWERYRSEVNAKAAIASV